jgi:hypothetical protein
VSVLVGLGSLVIGVSSLIIAIAIAYKQNIVLKWIGGMAEETKNIGIGTKSITEKLSTDYSIQEKSNKIFSIQENSDMGRRYKIVYPVKYTDKPLPLINQGDFYAIHILSLALGLEKIDLKEIESDKSSFDSSLTIGNSIFICSPQANPALNHVLPYATICKQTEKDMLGVRQNLCCSDEEIIAWFAKVVQIPCWFIDECKVRYDSNGKKELALIKKIQEYNKDADSNILNQAIESPAEQCYNVAHERKRKIDCGNIVDYGIFARITKNENHYIIISGIHQYGTWIVSDYLNNILRNKKVDKAHLDIYESDNDFIGIIMGEYNSTKMSVEFSSICGNKLWIRTSENQWLTFDKVQKG